MKSTPCRNLGSARLLTLALAVASTGGLVSAALLLGSCSEKGASGNSTNATGKTPSVLLDEAAEAMGRDDWKDAGATLDVVIAHPKATAEDKASAWQDKVVCEGRLHDDAAAIAVLEKMKAAKVELTDAQFGHMIQGLTSADRLDAAVAAIAAGTERFKGDEAKKAKFEKLASILNDRMEAKGDTAGQAKLRALGYVGGNK